MAEKLIAYSTKGMKPVSITETATAADLSGGGAEPKRIVTGTVADRPISLVERISSPPYTPETYNTKLINNWEMCGEAGLPVVPTLRTSSRDTILVTDVKADGSEAYGKGFETCLYASNRERLRPKIDEIFMEVTGPKEFPAIKAEARRYEKIANKNGIHLPTDDSFELVVHPDRSWDLMLLDITQVRRGNRLGVIYPNRRDTNYFLDTVGKIRKKMSADRSKTK